MTDYQRRIVDTELDELLSQLPAICLDGPKGVGKTTTALQRSVTNRMLGVAPQRKVAEADPFIIASDKPPVLIDEWQLMPEMWDTVRNLVDESPTPSRFLLTGSAPLGNTHSGAGRITSIRMRPYTLTERGICEPTVSLSALLSGDASASGRTKFSLVNYVDEIVASGFPGMRQYSGRAHSAQLSSYLDRIVDRDLPELGFTLRQPTALRAWLTAYAAATATTASWEKIRNAATPGYESKPAKVTAARFLELLTTLRIVDPIDAWVPTGSHLNNLGRAPKHHLADPALAVRLLHQNREHLLRGDQAEIFSLGDATLVGALFESLVALSIRTFAQSYGAPVYHLREHRGLHEIDFIIDTGNGVLAVEAKLASAVNDHDVRHLQWLRKEIGDELIGAVVVTTGPEAYRRKDGITVVPLSLLGV